MTAGILVAWLDWIYKITSSSFTWQREEHFQFRCLTVTIISFIVIIILISFFGFVSAEAGKDRKEGGGGGGGRGGRN